jgi:polar amino acid transport system substrate-binding protein
MNQGMGTTTKNKNPKLHFIQKCAKLCYQFTSILFLMTSVISSNALSQNIPPNTLNTPSTPNQINPKKINLLFSDAFVDKKKNLPMTERFYEIIKQFEEGLNVQFNIQLYPWNRAVSIATTQGELIFALSQTEERLKIFTFSEPVTHNYLWLVTRADKVFHYAKIEDLKGKTIDTFRGAKYGGDFDKNINVLFKIEESSGSYSQRLLRLHKNRVDAMVYSCEYSQAKEVEKQIKNIVKTDLQKNKEDNQYNFKVLPIPITKDSVRFAILKGSNEQLIININQLIKKLQSTNNKTP